MDGSKYYFVPPYFYLPLCACKKLRKMKKKFQKILIAPLDWGLGHATRCIPLIRLFRQQGREVLIASSGQALTLLKEEFTELDFYELPAYDIHYEHQSMVLNMMQQLPKLRRIIVRENRALKEILNSQNIDLIISDNRYGIHDNIVPSVFLGHQLAIQLPKSLKMLSAFSKSWHNHMLKPFKQIWVPDFAASPNLSGKLSHGLKMDTPVYFVGPLSRFRFRAGIKQDLPLLVLLSGQEPRRTQFEQKIIAQLEDWKEETLLIRGLPSESEVPGSPYPHLKIMNHLPSDRMEQTIARAKRIVCRSGYSSVMDFAAMHKKVLFVPTKGQTEQEYIAKNLDLVGHAMYVTEDRMNLRWDLERLDLMLPLKLENNRLAQLVSEALEELD
jgi:uncharacterized protein (TIGR00661 family)